MTDPKNPLRGSTTDDFDDLLSSLDDEKPPPRSPPAPPTPGVAAAPAPSVAPNTRHSDPGETSLFDDDADSLDIPTRMVDAEQIKREAGEVADESHVTRSGLDEVFGVQRRPTSPPRAELASFDDVPAVLGTLGTEREASGSLSLDYEDADVPTNPPPPLSADTSSPRLEALPVPAPLDSPELAELAREFGPDGEADAAIEETTEGDDAPAIDASPSEEEVAPALEVGDDDAGPSLDSTDDTPEFETDGGDETISLEVSDEPDEPRADVEADRGAMLAATVTSRKRWLEPEETAAMGGAVAEAEARAAMLEAEAPHATPERAAEMLNIAGELAEGILNDRARAKSLFDRALEADSSSVFALRALRRIALADKDAAYAAELCDSERQLALSDEEREDLDFYAAEVAARLGVAQAEVSWEMIGAGGEGLRPALAKLFLGGSRHDPSAMGDALGLLGQYATGTLAAAASLARARLAEGAAEGDTALAAVQSAVQRDPSDVTSWLAMARIAVGRENSAAFREALGGIARTSKESAASWAATALDRAAGGVLSDVIAPVAVPAAGVAGWLTFHALRDAGLDEQPQIDAALALANEHQRLAWSAMAADGGSGEDSDVRRYLALHRATQAGEPGPIASAAAALLDGDDPARAALESALLATKGALRAAEVKPLDLGEAMRIPELGATLLAATVGVDAAEAKVPQRGDTAFDRLADVERGRRTGVDAPALKVRLDEIARDANSRGVQVFAAREAARYDDEFAATVRALRAESEGAADRRRAATLQFLSAAIGAGLALEGLADEALAAAKALDKDVAAAELAALFGLRGEIPPEATSGVLMAAAGNSGSVASQISAVRAALRIGATEPEAAGDALFKVWQRARGDGPLAALTLRALRHDDSLRRAEILSTTAERAEPTSPAAALSTWTLVTHTLAEADKPADAARALARARVLAPTDAALMQWEETLWLRAGMFSEVAERSFDALKAATTDEAKIAAYERLAELDSTFRNDVASAVLTYQAILELSPGHMASLRTLERYFLEQSRYDELLGIYDRLIHHVADAADAVAIGRAAARIAIKQADGDHSAGTPFWAAAFERGRADLGTVLELDAESRRGGDARRFADVSMRGEHLATDPAEKATFATRAGEALLGLGDTAAAVETFARAVEYSPAHPIALAWLAHARRLVGDARGAAEAYEALGRSTKVPAFGVENFLAAAILWQDELQDADRARAALREVLAREPAHPDAFARSVRVLKDGGDKQSELTILEGRANAGGPPGELHPIHLRVAELAEELGDTLRARNALRAALAIEPDRQESLRSLGRLARGAADWTQAADAMIKLARHTQDATERTELMYTLGEIFDKHLADPKRAEAAYKRVLQLTPSEPRTLARLADLYGRTDNATAEAEALRQLAGTTPPGPARRGVQIRLAAVLSEKLNDSPKAEETLEAARRDAPTDMDVLRAFARLHVRQEAPMALAVLLDRAAADVRRQLDADLVNPVHFELLADMLKLRGRVDGARVVGAVAEGLGISTEKLAALSRDGTVPGAGANALTLEVLDMLAPPTVTAAHREMLRLSADVLEKLMPFEPGAVRAEKLGARPHPMRGEIERWAKIFALESIEIYLGPATPLIVTPIGRHPPAVMIPIDLAEGGIGRFAVARAMVIVAMSLPLVTRLPGRDVTLMLAAILRQFEPMFIAPGVDAPRLDDLARRITRALQRPRQIEITPHALEVIGGKATDGDAMAAGVVELATRVALLATGDLKGAMEALTPAGATPKTAVGTTPALGRLVRVALSDRFMEARHITGADKPASANS